MGDVAQLLPLRAAAGEGERTQKTSERGMTRTVWDPGSCPLPSASFSACEQPWRWAPLSSSLGPTSGPERSLRGDGHLASPTRGHTPTPTPSPFAAAPAPPHVSATLAPAWLHSAHPQWPRGPGGGAAPSGIGGEEPPLLGAQTL